MTEIVKTSKDEITQALKNVLRFNSKFFNFDNKRFGRNYYQEYKGYKNSPIGVMTPLTFLKIKDKNNI